MLSSYHLDYASTPPAGLEVNHSAIEIVSAFDPPLGLIYIEDTVSPLWEGEGRGSYPVSACPQFS